MNETDVTVTQKTAFITFWVIAVSLNAISSALLSVAVHRRKSCANILLLSMALTDIIVILLGLTPTVVTLFLDDLTHDGDILCYFQVIVLNWYILMSFFVVVTISIDQFLAVLCPFFYNSKILRIPRLSMKISLGLLFAFGVGILSYSIMGSLLCVLFPLPPTNVCYYDFQSTNLANRIFFFANTIAMGILIIVVVVCTVFLAGKLYQMYLQVDDEEDFFQQQKSSIAKISVIVAIVFMSSASLFMFVHVLYMAEVTVGPDLHYLSLCLVLSNTILFPFMFILIRASVRLILKGLCNKIFNLCRVNEASGRKQSKPIPMKKL